MKLVSIIIVSICLVSFTSCQYIGGQRVSGSGHITTQEKSIGSFNSIRIGGSTNVHVTQASSNSVKIEADDNLMPYIDVYVENNTLYIKPKSGYNLNPSKDITAYISSPSYREISVSGSGDIVGDNTISGNDPVELHVSGSGNINMQLNVPKVSTDVSGSGDITLKGQAKDFDAELSGSGKIKCFDLVTDNTTLHLSGSSDADVNANKTIDINVSGSGSVRYKGNPSINQHISGSGDVRKAD